MVYISIKEWNAPVQQSGGRRKGLWQSAKANDPRVQEATKIDFCSDRNAGGTTGSVLILCVCGWWQWGWLTLGEAVALSPADRAVMGGLCPGNRFVKLLDSDFWLDLKIHLGVNFREMSIWIICSFLSFFFRLDIWFFFVSEFLLVPPVFWTLGY